LVRSLDGFAKFCSLLRLEGGEQMRLEEFQRTMFGEFFAGCRESVACLPKGSGKTSALAALSLYELLSDPGCEGAVVASSRDQAALLLGQLRGFVERSPGLASRVRLKQREAVNRRTGGRFRVLAADVDGLDGLLCTYAVADELHRWKDSERYAILLAGCQKRHGRLFGISTAGVKDEGLLWQMREKALELGAKRAGAYLGLRTDRFAWHEWSLPEDGDFHDLAQVKAANPAPWVSPEILRERFDSPSMTDLDFRRFSANQWVERRELETVFDAASWSVLLDPKAQPLPPACLALDATFDRSAAAIGVAAFTDQAGSRPLVDLAEHGAGIAWSVERIVSLSRRHETVGVIVDPGGPAATLIPRLQDYGLQVHETSTREVAMASAAFYDAVLTGALRHHGAAPLTASVQGAVRRSLSQSWAFDRRKAISDPSPLMAAALALHGLMTHGPISQSAYDQRFGRGAVPA
jgi:Phage Terminase